MSKWQKDNPKYKSLDDLFKERTKTNINGCHIWIGWVDKKGYGSTWWRGKSRKTHHLAWINAHPDQPITKGLNVCHNCPGGDNRACISPSHLWAGTAEDNVLDAMTKGRMKFDHLDAYRGGESSIGAKITESDVHEIRRLRLEGATVSELMAKFPLKMSQLSRIARRQSWSHIP